MATLDQVAAQVTSIDQTLESNGKLDEERRKTDDARYESLNKGQEKIGSVLEGHEKRITTAENNWTNFFGPQGAFGIFAKNQDIQGKKIDRLTWIAASGIGALAAIQFYVEFFRVKL